jgi:hypothetical protein
VNEVLSYPGQVPDRFRRQTSARGHRRTRSRHRLVVRPGRACHAVDQHHPLCCSRRDPASLLEVENDADASNRAIRDVVASVRTINHSGPDRQAPVRPARPTDRPRRYPHRPHATSAAPAGEHHELVAAPPGAEPHECAQPHRSGSALASRFGWSEQVKVEPAVGDATVAPARRPPASWAALLPRRGLPSGFSSPRCPARRLGATVRASTESVRPDAGCSCSMWCRFRVAGSGAGVRIGC